MNTRHVYSDLALDPDLGELVDLFVQEMPERVQALEDLAGTRNWQALVRAAHQLKGAAGSYGFDVITPYAARLEYAARSGQPDAQILAALQELVDLCRLVRSGPPQAEDATAPSTRTESTRSLTS